MHHGHDTRRHARTQTRRPFVIHRSKRRGAVRQERCRPHEDTRRGHRRAPRGLHSHDGAGRRMPHPVTQLSLTRRERLWPLGRLGRQPIRSSHSCLRSKNAEGVATPLRPRMRARAASHHRLTIGAAFARRCTAACDPGRRRGTRARGRRRLCAWSQSRRRRCAASPGAAAPAWPAQRPPTP